MDKIVSIRRRAQRYVQSGDLTRAVAEYEKLLEAGDLDPYDYLYLGDLLVRADRTDDAVSRYREAITAYERVGLFKNAIAVGKKLLRLRPELFEIHRTVGSLYYQEGLLTDSLFYYMQFLSAAPSPDEAASIEEVGLRVLGMPLPNPDLAIQVLEILKTARCSANAAEALVELAHAYQAHGAEEWGDDLLNRAIEIDPEIADRLNESRHAAPPAGAVCGAEASGEAPLAALNEEPAAANADPAFEFGMVDLPPNGDPDGYVAPPAAGVYDAGAGESVLPQAIDVPGLSPEEEAVQSGKLSVDELVSQGQDWVAAGDIRQAQRCYLAAARAAFTSGESRRSETIYAEMVRLDPNHLEALTGLTEIAHINGERAKIVRYGCELGDVLLAASRYEEAKLEFERVLQFDPGNDKARARVARLNSIEGVDQVTARPLAPVASEVQGATVSVRGEESGQTHSQSLLDLSQIMQEFQSAMSRQIEPGDGQAHYDLGMAYLDMGVWDQAAAEFDQAAAQPEMRSRALEMKARSLLEAEQPELALAAIEESAELAEDDPARRALLSAYRGQALEAMGRIDEAARCFEEALSLDPGLELAREGALRLSGGASGAAA